jgi:hypothetical protein
MPSTKTTELILFYEVRSLSNTLPIIFRSRKIPSYYREVNISEVLKKANYAVIVGRSLKINRGFRFRLQDEGRESWKSNGIEIYRNRPQSAVDYEIYSSEGRRDEAVSIAKYLQDAMVDEAAKRLKWYKSTPSGQVLIKGAEEEYPELVQLVRQIYPEI